MRVLTVARWYPSHDSPGRGSFVAELVDATAGHGAQHVVASIDHIGTAGQMADPNRQLRRAREAFRSRLQPSATLSRPRTWGPGAPVARLPVLDELFVKNVFCVLEKRSAPAQA